MNETMNTCRNYIRNNPNVTQVFENYEECSVCAGFEYTLDDSTHIKLRVDKAIGYVIMEAYPGMTVRGAHQSMVCEYCQLVSGLHKVGYLALDPDWGRVYFHIENHFRDSPITEKHLQEMEQTANRVLSIHYPVLERLAYGRLPDLDSVMYAMKQHEDGAPKLTEEDQRLLDLNITAIREYMMGSGSFVAAETIGNYNSAPSFYLEQVSDETAYRENIRILPSGWLTYSVRLDLRCHRPYLTQLCQHCNEVSNSRRIGYLRITPDGFPVFIISTYLLDRAEPISQDILEHMSGFASDILERSEKDLRYIGHGVLPPRETDIHLASMIKSLLKRTRHPDPSLGTPSFEQSEDPNPHSDGVGHLFGIGSLIKAACSDSPDRHKAQSILDRQFGNLQLDEDDLEIADDLISPET